MEMSKKMILKSGRGRLWEMVIFRGGGGGGTPDLKWREWSNGGKTQTPPKKSMDQKLTPKKSHAELPSLKNFAELRS